MKIVIDPRNLWFLLRQAWPKTLARAVATYDALLAHPEVQLLLLGDSELAAALAKLRPTPGQREVAASHPRAQGVWGFRNGGTVRRYVCYLCDIVVATDSARYRGTARANRALDAHLATHGEEP